MLVDDAGHACLGDFGQSFASDSRKYLDSSHVGSPVNPFYFMAPELMLGGSHAKATDKSDIFSFGCVLYQVGSNSSPVILMFIVSL